MATFREVWFATDDQVAKAIGFRSPTTTATMVLEKFGDAEVLECIVDDSDSAIPMQLLTPEYHGLPLWDMGLRHDDRVTLIIAKRPK